MLSGIFVKGYKVYKNVKFIPFFEFQNENLKLLIGPNGAGKSSILEALDTFLNTAKWTVHIEKDDSYVAPLFLLEKNKISKFSETSQNYIKKISNFLWSVSIEDNKTIYQPISEFFEFRNVMKLSYENDYYLFLLGISSNISSHKKDFSFATFDSKIKNDILNLQFYDDENKKLKYHEQQNLTKFLKEIQDNFTYVYIPAETNISEFLRLESNDMQKLLDKGIIDNIDNILNEKNITSSNISLTQSNKNILELINDQLQPYVDEIEKTIQQIYPGYKFQAEGSAKLSAKDINRQIIQAFYAKRKLKKDSKSIGDLSSGERKKALIDIAFSFLNHKIGKLEKEIILAIDEPEASLDMSIRYEQFETIEKLSKICQVFIATHWYGSLPILQNGLINHIEKEEDGIPKIRIYNVKNYFEDRKDDPDDIYFKSFSELAQSILISLKSKEFNWIIVEGPEDKNYLEYYLKDEIKNLRILPVGGCGSVKILYQYLFISMSRKSNSNLFKGKVYCLVDTDSQTLNIEQSETDNKKLFIRRLQCQKNNDKKEIKLIRINTPFINPTEIEETLNPEQFYLSLKNTIEKINDAEIKKAFLSFEFYPTVPFSFVRGDDSILNPIPQSGRKSIDDKQAIIKFIEKNKFLISEEYCRIEKKETPLWVKEIIEFFNSQKEVQNIVDVKTIRVSKAAKELKIGVSTIVDFLNSKGLIIEANPNAKLNEEAYQLLKQEFSPSSPPVITEVNLIPLFSAESSESSGGSSEKIIEPPMENISTSI